MQIVVSVTGKSQPGLLTALLKAFFDCNCCIAESRSMVLADDFSGFWLLEGNWNHVARLENSLEHLRDQFGIRCFHHQVTPQDNDSVGDHLPYIVDVYGMDRLGVANEIAGFFSARNIVVREMSISRIQPVRNQSELFSIHCVVMIPTDGRPISLRDEFLEFCDGRNMDAILEPMKR